MKIKTLYKSLTGVLMLAVFVLGTTFNFESKADEETSYTPTTLITGANRGIGLEFTRQYLEMGWNVIATARKPGKADQLIDLKEKYPDHLTIQQLDVTDHERIDELALELKDQPIDLLLNNAGISGGSSNQLFGNMDYDVYESVLSVNTIGPLKMAEAFYPHVKNSELKKIVSVSSSEGSIGTAFKRGGGRLFFYRSSKTALNMVMVNLAFQLKSRGIAVGMVNPGLTDTDFVSDMPFPMRSAELAVSDMIRNIETISVDNTAAYINYNGKPVPW
tara:strand:+ start:620 stop:1444 length:825 start_codon:yes stop_codon:yes gene_type:complete